MQDEQPGVTIGTDPDGKSVIWLHPPASVWDLPPEAFSRLSKEARKDIEWGLRQHHSFRIYPDELDPSGPRYIRSDLTPREKEIIASGWLTLAAFLAFVLTGVYLWSLT